MRRLDGRRVSSALVLLVGLVAPLARGEAAEPTDVASSFDKDNAFDFNLRVGYDWLSRSAAVKREREEPGQSSIVVYKDLVYRQVRHSMSLRAELGIYQDLSLSVELPMVLSDERTLEYDQRKGAECIYTGSDANCTNAGNAISTNSEQAPGAPGASDPKNFILPPGGFDAAASSSTVAVPFPQGSNLVFQGPHRGGSGKDLLDTLNLTLSWAVLSQKRDDTKPTWVLSLGYHASVGNVMRFDRMNPGANHGVSDGLDHLVARTAVSHRFKYADPYVIFWFDYPFARRDDTLFVDLGKNAKNAFPQMSAGTRFGFEGIPFEDTKHNFKVAIDVSGRIEGRFDGRGYSEIWEMLASSPALGCDAAWNPSCNLSSNPYKTGDGRNPYTGLTTIENYLTLGAELALVVQATRFFRLRGYFRYQHDSSHFVTTDDVGTPAVPGMRVSAPEEYNPAYRAVINDIGRRYKVDDVDSYGAGVYGQLMF